MTARPSQDVRWAYGMSAIKTDPTLARREEGWVPGLPPLGSNTNYIMNATGEWVAYLDETNGLTSAKGWVSVPTPTISGGGADVAFGTGSVIINGHQYDAPASATFTGHAASTNYYFAFDVLSGIVDRYTTWDDANASGRVPLWWGKTDGSSLFATSTSSLIARRIGKALDTLTLTVAQDSAHSANFTSLREAIAFARAIQQGSSLVANAITIEIIGDIVEPASLNDPQLYLAQRLRFVGRAGAQTGGSIDARIRFAASGTEGLFHLTSTAAMVGWSFENLTFQFSGSATSQVVGVVTLAGSSTATNLRFHNCFVYSTGVLPKFIYGGGSHISGLSITECRVYTSDAMVHMASGNLTDLTVRHSTYDWAGSGPGTVFGGIVAHAGEPVRWRIESCRFGASLSLGGPAVLAVEIKDLFITDSFVYCSGNAPVVDLGSVAYVDVEMVHIHDNEIRRVANPVSSEPIVRIRSQDDANLGAPIFIHSNTIMGDDAVTATAIAVHIDSNGNTLTGPIIHSNRILRVQDGVSLSTGVIGAIVGPNSMTLVKKGLILPNNKTVAIGNTVTNDGTDAFDVDGDDNTVVGNWTNGGMNFNGTDRTMIAGNQVGGTLDVSAGSADVVTSANNVGTMVASNSSGVFSANMATSIQSLGDNNVYTGNLFDTIVDIVSTSDNLVFVGNMISEPGLSLACSTSVFAGNVWNGTVTATTDADDNVWTANLCNEAVVIPSGAADWIIAGNRFRDTLTWNGTGQSGPNSIHSDNNRIT